MKVIVKDHFGTTVTNVLDMQRPLRVHLFKIRAIIRKQVDKLQIKLFIQNNSTVELGPSSKVSSMYTMVISSEE